MRRRLTLAVLGLLLQTVLLNGQEAGLTAEANRSQLYLGESFILKVNLSDAQQTEPDLSAITNARIRSLGKQTHSSFNISFVNGQMVRQGFSGLVCHYEITPMLAGTFQAGPIRAVWQGQQLEIAGPLVTVTDIEEQDWVRIAISSSRATALVDEPFQITLSIRVKRPPGLPDGIQPLFPRQPPALTVPWLTLEPLPGLAGPDIESLLNSLLIAEGQPGFCINDIRRQTSIFDLGSFMGRSPPAIFSLEREMDGDYADYFLTVTYTPQDEGDYVFGPVIFKGAIPVAISAQGQAESHSVFAVGAAATVRVMPPPEEGRPAQFTGALGSKLLVSAAFDTDQCRLGDPINLTVSLSGPLRFDRMVPPKLSLQTNLASLFTIYDNTVKTERNQNDCRFVYTARPLQAGRLTVPPVEVAYYDTVQRAYVIVASRPMPLQVLEATEVTAAEMRGHTNLPSVRAQADDRELKPAAVMTDSAGISRQPLLGKKTWLWWALAGPLIYLSALALPVWLRLRRRGLAQRYRKRALPRALNRLKSVEGLGVTANAKVANQICLAARCYLSERLGMAAAGLTPADISQLLAVHGVDPELSVRLTRLFERAFNAAYGSQCDIESLQADARQLAVLLSELETAIK